MVFRPSAAVLTSLAFVLCLTLHQRQAKCRSAWAMGSLVWIGLAFWPLQPYKSVWSTQVAVFLLLGASYKFYRPSPSQRVKPKADTAPKGPSVEITWRGFTALFAAAAPGEGERFIGSVLADAQTIVAGCSGQRVKGSDLNGIYRFPDETALTQCLERLAQYHQQTSEVLAGAEAPGLELVVERQ